MKVLKFGGKSLSSGLPLKNTIEIIKAEHQEGDVSVVVSALGNSTDRLIDLYELAVAGKDFKAELEAFFALQNNNAYQLNLDEIFLELRQILEALKALKLPTEKAKDKVLSFGEVISAKVVSHLLQQEGMIAEFVDARNLLKGHYDLHDFVIDLKQSEKLTLAYFQTLKPKQVPVITGYIASDEQNHTATLGRNGTNYSTSLIASFISAEEVQNWTDVNGIYTASPKYVPQAQLISYLSYKEAHELANFGANILHPRTIGPLMAKGIPLKIFNSNNRQKAGTIVGNNNSGKGIKAVSVVENVALVTIEGRGLAGKIGIDARIFSVLSNHAVSIRLISQASSERGIGFVVDADVASLAKKVLEEEFAKEFESAAISSINTNTEMAIIAIVGRHNYSLEKAIKGLRRNKIWMYLISNSISGEHISLVIDNKELKKAVNVVHNQVFGAIKTINLFALGKGEVGGKLLDQIIATSDNVITRRNLKINVIGVADSKKAVFNDAGLDQNWRESLAKSSLSNNIEGIIELLKNSALENIVIADNTSSQAVTDTYPELLNNSFDLVASNKKANSGNIDFYRQLREILKRKGGLFYYETNVGAGLPLIDTLKHHYDSADNVLRIRGVFSGSLSYIFNNFSIRAANFSEILLEAKDKGFTEPDAREDLNGLDVARKLIILARELGLEPELKDVDVQNLIPQELESIPEFETFMGNKEIIDAYFEGFKKTLKEDEVLRYVGDLDVPANTLKVSLVKVSKNSPLGNIKNADALFEIYTEGYGDQPIVIQGAGAGGEVTARGVYSDLLRMGSKY